MAEINPDSLFFQYSCYCVKSVCFLNFSCPYFPAFGLNTEIYKVNLRIQSKCSKIPTRKSPNTDTFSTVCLFTKRFESRGVVKTLSDLYDKTFCENS